MHSWAQTSLTSRTIVRAETLDLYGLSETWEVRAMRLLALFVALATSLFVTTAQAEDVLVLSLGGDADAALRAPVLQQVQDLLVADGFVVAGPSELVHRVPPSRLAPSTPAEAVTLAADLSIPRVVCVSVWAVEGHITELSLSLQALSGRRSARDSTATAIVQPTEEARALAVRTMVTQVLASERAASMLDPARVSTVAPEPDPEETPQPAPGALAPGEPEPLFGIIGPGLLTAIGAAGLGLGIWGVLDETCDLRGASGLCLRGESNNVGVGAVLIITGAASLAGAIAWWIITPTVPASPSRIDIALGPTSLHVRGTF